MNKESIARVNLNSLSTASNYLQNLIFNARGVKRLCFHESDASTLQVMLIEALPSDPFPYHYHKDIEFILLVSGILKVTYLGGQELTLRKCFDDYLLVEAGMVHATQAMQNGTKYLEIKPGPFKAGSTVIYEGPESP